MLEFIGTFIAITAAITFVWFFVWVARLPLPQPNYSTQAWRCDSYIEERVYKALVKRNHKVVPQYNVGPYRLDLAFPVVRLAIECDGKAYHSSPAQKARDRRRDAYLRRRGWTVLRFSGRKINGDIGGVVARIESELAEGS